MCVPCVCITETLGFHCNCNPLYQILAFFCSPCALQPSDAVSWSLQGPVLTFRSPYQDVYPAHVPKELLFQLCPRKSFIMFTWKLILFACRWNAYQVSVVLQVHHFLTASLQFQSPSPFTFSLFLPLFLSKTFCPYFFLCSRLPFSPFLPSLLSVQCLKPSL